MARVIRDRSIGGSRVHTYRRLEDSVPAGFAACEACGLLVEVAKWVKRHVRVSRIKECGLKACWATNRCVRGSKCSFQIVSGGRRELGLCEDCRAASKRRALVLTSHEVNPDNVRGKAGDGQERERMVWVYGVGWAAENAQTSLVDKD